MGTCLSRFKKSHVPLEEIYVEPVPITHVTTPVTPVTPLKIRIPKNKDEDVKLDDLIP
jgi:hypothetical protein